MATTITINGSVTLDESLGLQNSGIAVIGEDNNDSDVSLGTLQSTVAAFSNRLFNSVATGGLGLSTTFATDNGVAESASNFITVSGGTVAGLGFVDGNGGALPGYAGVATGGVATGLSAVNGGAISLFADATLGNRMVLGVDASNDVVFAIFMDPNAELTSARVWMVQFEAISNPNPTNPDDPVNLFDSIGVAASTTLAFDFNSLHSGDSLFGTVGDVNNALIVIAEHPVIAADGTLVSSPNGVIKTSQGGTGATIGVNSQMFDPGEGAYFTYVNNPNPNFVDGALSSTEADDADNILYTGGTNAATSASTSISQTQGNALATMKITALDIADSPQQRDFVSGLSPTTGKVDITSVTITHANLTTESETAGGPDTSNNISFSSGIATVSGLGSGDTIAWTTSAPHDRVLIEGVAGKFDIGGFAITQTSSSSVDIGNQLTFEDDGPSITASATGAPTLTVDETVLATDATGSFSAQFSPSFGADGQGATPVSYALSTPGGASGLTDTATGESVVLSLNASGQVVGKTATTGLTVFVVSVDASGNVTLDQQRAIVHADPNNPDESRGLTGSNLVALTATVTDGDGDHASAPLDLTPQLVFKDDGPAIGPIANSVVDFANDATGTATKTLNGVVGADQNATPYTIDSFTFSITINGTALQGVATNSNETITYWADTNNDTIFGDAGDTQFYKLQLSETANSGAGSYTFTVLQNPPPAERTFDFNSLHSGDSLFGTVGDVNNALIVIAEHPVIAADGTLVSSPNGVIKTSQGGTGATIGVNSQMFDPGEGAYFTYVNNPNPNFVDGALSSTEADDADNILYTGGTNAATSASTSISQTQGNALATMKITALDIADSPQQRDFVSGLSPTTGKVDITSVTITHANLTTESETAGGPDTSNNISFSSGIATVSGLGSGDKIAWTTSAPHDRVLIEGVAGKFDIGGFAITQAQATPDQKLDFVARATDGDGDFKTASFSIGIDGTGVNHDGHVVGVG